MKKQLDNQDSLRGCVLDMLHAVREAQLVLTMSAPPTEWREQAISLLTRRADSVREVLGVKPRRKARRKGR